MSVVAEKPPLTPAGLLALPDGKGFELVDGVFVERNVGVLSSWVAGQIFALIRDLVVRNQLVGLSHPTTASSVSRNARTRSGDPTSRSSGRAD